MRIKERALARIQLDKGLNPLRDSDALVRPIKGWVKAIREALGLTAEQLARRVGVSKPRVYEIEKSEMSGSITLHSLERAAHALECQLVYALVPKQPLQEIVEARAMAIANELVRSSAHSMMLEDQAVDEETNLELIDQLAKELLNQRASRLWDRWYEG